MTNDKSIIEKRYSSRAEEYRKIAKGLFYSPRDFIDTNLHSQTNLDRMKVLDAGCGDALSSEYFIDSNCKITGMDLSQGLIKRAKIRHPDHKWIIHDLDKSWPIEANSVDIVISFGVLEFLQSIRFAFHESYRTLITRGIFCFSIELIDNYTDCHKMTCREQEIIGGSWYSWRYYRDEIERDLCQSGFSILGKKTVEAYYHNFIDKRVKYEIYTCKKI